MRPLHFRIVLPVPLSMFASAIFKVNNDWYSDSSRLVSLYEADIQQNSLIDRLGQ